MRIYSLELENFRLFEKKRIDFPEGSLFSVLIGENASGKTTVLDAVAYWLWADLLGAFVRGEDKEPSMFATQSDFRYTIDRFNERNEAISFRIGLSFQLEGFPKEENRQLEMMYLYKRTDEGVSGIRQVAPPTVGTRDFYLDAKKALFERRDTLLPVFEFFPARSSSLLRVEVSPEFTKSGSTRILKGYLGAMEKSNQKVSDFLNWYKTTSADSQNLPRDKYPEKAYLHDQLECIHAALALAIPQWQEPHFVFGDNDMLGRLVRSEDPHDQGELIYFRELSDGYQRMIGLVGTIAWRCASLNPHFGKEAHLHSPGIVLIDELDLHLHPKWQRRIVSDLKRAFPKIQFICTTHSPFIVQSLTAEEVIDLDGQIEYNPNDLAIEDVAEMMGVESPYSLENQKMEELSTDYLKKLQEALSKGRIVGPEINGELDEMEARVSDPAIRAFLKMQRLQTKP